MALWLAFVLALIPTAIAPGWFFFFDVTPKIVVLLLGTAGAALWWAASGRAARLPRAFLLAMGGLAASVVLSTLTSVNRPLSVGGSSWRYWGLLTQLAALGFAWLLAVCCAGRAGALRTILRAGAVSGLATALYGIAQYFGFDPLLDPSGYHIGEGVWTIVRPPSTLGHADYFAIWLLFAVFASTALAVTEEAQFWKWLARMAAAVCSVAIILSGTRAAALGLAFGAISFVVWRGFRVTRRMALAALAVVLAGVAFYLSPAGALMRARVHWVKGERLGGARFLLWRDSLRMAAARLPLGFGPETYIPSFARYQSTELSRAYPDFYHESPHNIFLDALVAQGVVGLALLLALIAAGFASAWKVRQNPQAAALASGLAAMIISQQFACFTMPTAIASYVTIAMLVSLRAGEPQPARRQRAMRLAIAASCAAILAFFGLRLYLAETAMADVRRYLAASRLGAAADRYAEYENVRWPGGGADLSYSRRLQHIAYASPVRYIKVQAFQQALRAAQRATETSEDPFNAWYNLASIYASQNDFARTDAALRAAISSAPNWFKPHWLLAEVLQAAGRLQEAESEAAQAAALDGGQHAEVTGTLTHIRAALAAGKHE